MALEEELARLEMALLQVSLSAAVFPVLLPAYRALAMKSFEMCLEHAAAVMTGLLLERGSVKACTGSEPFRALVARAMRAGVVSDGKGWRQYRDCGTKAFIVTATRLPKESSEGCWHFGFRCEACLNWWTTCKEVTEVGGYTFPLDKCVVL